MIKNLFGLFNKSDQFYLELDNKEPNQATVTQPSTSPAPKTTKKVEKKANRTKNKKATNQVGFSAASNDDLATTLLEKYRNGFADNTPVKFAGDSASVDNVELVIKAAYKQVFGNAHIMDSERLTKIESQMRNGQIQVIDFIQSLAKSDLYRKLFWEKCSNVTAIELNFKHILGRAPDSYDEISQHMKILAEEGFDAEIDSYIYSEEYIQNFGYDQVPYFRGYDSQNGKNLVSFTHSFPLLRVACSSDKSTLEYGSPKLEANLIEKNASSIPSIREITDSYPVSFVSNPKKQKHVPSNFILMARNLNIKSEDPMPAWIKSSAFLSQSTLTNKSEPAMINDSQNQSFSVKASNNTTTSTAIKEDLSVETSSYRRRVINSKKFMDMARNIPYHLR